MISYASKFIVSLVAGALFLACFSYQALNAQDEAAGAEEAPGGIDAIANRVAQGISIGDARAYPYPVVAELSDIYGAIIVTQPAFWNAQDRMVYAVKVENLKEHAFKLKYVANSLSSERTRLAFLVKTKSTDDLYYYGLGSSISKSNRQASTYNSLFFGTEVTRLISSNLALAWSPGVWLFRSGLDEGGEFEQAANARYITSRFTLGSIRPLDYQAEAVTQRWSTYLEIGMPFNTTASTYARLNLQSATRIPVYKRTSFSISTRVETLLSGNRALIPYYAMPEAGSRSGMRAFSKERFRHFAIGVINLEYAVAVSQQFEAFVLSDLARTASNVLDLARSETHQDFGLGLRLTRGFAPVAAGFAAGNEGWKLFADISIGL